MTAMTIPASRWDLANGAPQPQARMVLHCSEGHVVTLPHHDWHLADELRCQQCGCLADVVYARRHGSCPCDEAVRS